MPTSRQPPSCNEFSSGQLICSRIPVLLIKAVNENFEGSIILKTPTGAHVGILFAHGSPSRIVSPVTERVVWTVLSEQLPPEQLQFIKEHAQAQKQDLFTAIQQLVLLPQSTLERLHTECLQLQIEWICGKPGSVHYSFFANKSCFQGKPGMTYPSEPLSLIVDCLRKSSDLNWCREQLTSSRRRPLILMGRLATANYPLTGVLRQVVLTLRREEDSYETLRLRRIAPEKSLIAVVYTLRSTGSAATPHAQPQSSRHSSGASSSLQPINTLLSTEPASTQRATITTKRDRPQSDSRIKTSKLSARVSRPPSATQAPTSQAPASQAPVSRRPARTLLPPFSTLPPHSKIQDRSLAEKKAQTATSTSGVQRMNTAVTTPAMPAVRAGHSITPQNEHNIEASALQAWMRAVDEPESRIKALSIAQRAAGHFPKNPRILFYLGCILSLTGNTPAAEATLQLVLEIDPDHSEASREFRRLLATNKPDKPRPGLLNIFGRQKQG